MRRQIVIIWLLKLEHLFCTRRCIYGVLEVSLWHESLRHFLTIFVQTKVWGRLQIALRLESTVSDCVRQIWPKLQWKESLVISTSFDEVVFRAKVGYRVIILWYFCAFIVIERFLAMIAHLSNLMLLAHLCKRINLTLHFESLLDYTFLPFSSLALQRVFINNFVVDTRNLHHGCWQKTLPTLIHLRKVDIEGNLLGGGVII